MVVSPVQDAVPSGCPGHWVCPWGLDELWRFTKELPMRGMIGQA